VLCAFSCWALQDHDILVLVGPQPDPRVLNSLAERFAATHAPFVGEVEDDAGGADALVQPLARVHKRQPLQDVAQGAPHEGLALRQRPGRLPTVQELALADLDTDGFSPTRRLHNYAPRSPSTGC